MQILAIGTLQHESVILRFQRLHKVDAAKVNREVVQNDLWASQLQMGCKKDFTEFVFFWGGVVLCLVFILILYICYVK